MDRKNGPKHSASNSSRRKQSTKSNNGTGSLAAELKDSKTGGKVDWNSNIPQQQQHPSNFASVHRPRQLSSIAAIKRTVGQSAVDGRESSQFTIYGSVETDRTQLHHQQQQQQRPQQPKGGKALRCEPYGINLLARSNAKVAVLPSAGKEPSPFGRIQRPLDSGVIGENNGRIFNQPSLPLPVQIPSPPYAQTAPTSSVTTTGLAASSHYGHHHQQQQQHQVQRFPAASQQQQTPVSQKTDYPLQSGAIRQGVNQKCSSSAAASLPPGPTEWLVDSTRRSALPAAVGSGSGSLRFAGGKLTPKLLNDIYEKHLLSQTTFEVGSTGTKGALSNNSSAKHGSSETASRTLTKSDTRLRAVAATFGGSPQTGSITKDGCASTAAVAHNYDHAHTTTTTTTTILGPTEDNLYESVRSNYHIYEKIDSRRSSLGGLPSSAAALEQYVRPIGPQPTVGPLPPPLHPRPKSHPAGGIDPHANDEPTGRIPPAPPVRQNATPVKMIASGGLANSTLSPIQERPPLPPTLTNRAPPPSRTGSARNDRVNIALETAKAIATAAYIER
ncbi:hypothetical protein ZHAS_00013589 [Anopheles sinensis]|uniref:Uncharacterized protein n=1 Tax=Anopheles sinensis TaxID=74873 RepID=A0A084W5V6_ANOSI|nr:hypothetical protein ZHAS_00013589 [Anopheles sinensis]